MRMIEAFTQGLALILSSKKKERWHEMERNISALCEKLLGTDYKLFANLDAENILALLRKGDFIDGAKAWVLAMLFAEEAGSQAKRQNIAAAEDLRYKSATLLLEILKIDNQKLCGLALEKLPQLLEQLHTSQTPPRFRERLFLYFELCGKFDKAENILFDLATAKTRNIQTEGILFYKRLQGKTDAELAAGNFSRQEIAEGRADFMRLFNEGNQNASRGLSK